MNQINGQIKLCSLALLVLLTAFKNGQAQQPQPSICITTPDVVSGQPNWNWEVNLYDTAYAKTWGAYTYGSASGPKIAMVIGAPWYEVSTDQIALIAATKDYTRAKGWRLLRVNFGCTAVQEHPWFVLYNQYTGVLRIFIWLNNLNNMNKGAMISLKQVGNRITALGSNSSVLLNAPDYYQNNAVASGSDYVSVIVTTAGSIKWASADFQTTLDPNASNPMFAGSELVFQIHGIQESTVDLAGKFKFTTEEATPAIAGEPIPTQGITNENTFVADGKKVMAKITNGVKGTQSVLGKINSGATALAQVTFKGAYQAPGKHGNFKKGVYDFATALADVTRPSSATSEASGLQKVLSKVLKVSEGLSGAIPALSLLGPVLGILFPGEDEAVATAIPFTPTVSTGDISLTGTIKTLSPQNTPRIQIPGTIHNNNVPTTLPYYNCALGVFNISYTPVLLKSTPDSVKVEHVIIYAYDPRTIRKLSENTTKLGMSTYKLDNYLAPVFNNSAGLTPISVQGAIVFQRQNTPSDNLHGIRGNARTDILADPFIDNWPATGSTRNIDYSYNPTLSQFEAGNLIVNKMDSNNIEFQTPFISLTCLPSVTARVPSDAKAFIRVRALFKRNDAPEQPPIVVVFDYNTREVPNASITHAYPATGIPDATWAERLQQPGSGYRNLSIVGNDLNPIVFGPTGTAGDNLAIRSSESIEITGNVSMPAGTTIALITEFQQTNCTSSFLATPVSGTGCETNDSTWWRTLSSEKVTEKPNLEIAEISKLVAFPNPNKGTFSIDPKITMGDKFSVSVHSILGQLIYSQQYNYQGKPIVIKMLALRTGIYVVNVTSAKGSVHTAKIKVD